MQINPYEIRYFQPMSSRSPVLNPQAQTAWAAQLNLHFAPNESGQITRLVQNTHSGPLRVQRALYPESNGCCHAIILHPPAGIAGGDRLTIRADLAQNAHALLTTPGAGKFYGHGGVGEQMLNFSVADGGFLEWLPQETIVFDRSHGHSETTIHLAAEAAFIGWEISVFGRRDHGEQFTHGQWHNTISIFHNDALILHDPLHVQAASRWFASPLGLDGNHVCAHSWLQPPSDQRPHSDAFIAQVRDHFADDPAFSITAIDPLLIARHYGSDVRHCFAQLARLRALARRAWFDFDENYPRIWRT